MISRFRTIFSDDCEYILGIYKSFLSSSGSQSVREKLVLSLLEVGVRFGERIAQLNQNGFIEIGCGLAIPSLTVAKLGCNGCVAMDIDPRIIASAQELKRHLGYNIEIECRDIFADRPEIQKGQLLIAEKPASYKKNTLEVEYNISNWCKIEGHSLAIIPSYLCDDTPELYSERCAKYEKKFRQTGFKVENRQVYDQMPYRWLIATK